MSAPESSGDTIFYLADPAWLDAVIAHLEKTPHCRSELARAQRNMVEAITECGCIGPDGRVQLFFTPPAFEKFLEAAGELEPGWLRTRGHFSHMAAARGQRP